ncbi:hypothetical protein NS202_12115 [Mammaliicoccus sciuri]|uniref:hypothetical protein n=1 Tax=Mammaliicoccus sciuri TaxID=1296 RepID=UPI000734CC59|nr:hypothetical protein [Mammaliicoccus sciuri]KTT79868.1 hypothetical protein NS202_12115 [Mammaliicoccus sciuri]MCJ0953584.1 hypothetical protein [Mammaliicoccus sciuri]
MSNQKDILQTLKDRKNIDLSQYKKAAGFEIPIDSNIKNEVSDMSEYISRKEFEQYEKRIDDQFATINTKIDNLPNTLADKITIALNQYEKEIKRDSKENRKAVITWILSGTGILIALAGLIGRVIGLY